MDAELRKLESAAKDSPAYARAGELLVRREKLEQEMRDIDRELEAIGLAAQIARIDRLRQALAASSKTFVLAG